MIRQSLFFFAVLYSAASSINQECIGPLNAVDTSGSGKYGVSGLNGWEFSVKEIEDISVLSLGIFGMPDAFVNVSLWDETSRKILDSVVIAPISKNSWTFETLQSPIKLTPRAKYSVLADSVTAKTVSQKDVTHFINDSRITPESFGYRYDSNEFGRSWFQVFFVDVCFSAIMCPPAPGLDLYSINGSSRANSKAVFVAAHSQFMLLPNGNRSKTLDMICTLNDDGVSATWVGEKPVKLKEILCDLTNFEDKFNESARKTWKIGAIWHIKCPPNHIFSDSKTARKSPKCIVDESDLFGVFEFEDDENSTICEERKDNSDEKNDPPDPISPGTSIRSRTAIFGMISLTIVMILI